MNPGFYFARHLLLAIDPMGELKVGCYVYIVMRIHLQCWRNIYSKSHYNSIDYTGFGTVVVIFMQFYQYNFNTTCDVVFKLTLKTANPFVLNCV